MDMGTQGSGRKRLPNRERLTAEDDALNQIARESDSAVTLQFQGQSVQGGNDSHTHDKTTQSSRNSVKERLAQRKSHLNPW
ncbi:leucine-rich repeat flightless-interacting protein 1 isoform 3 [Cricetulus griseus]|nr:leucine-rich repeat flightless-interacting protein 1 isoform 3 [Cricetulus griseus]